MPAFSLRTYSAEPYAGGFSIALNISRTIADPFPARRVICKTTAEALAALESYRAEVAAACTAPVAVGIYLATGDRAPSGWRKLASRATLLPANFDREGTTA